MNITKIEKETDDIYVVTFTPTTFEKYFGYTEKVRRYKDTGNVYTYGGGCTVYINEQGEKLGNGNWIATTIDNWNRAF